MSWVLLLKRRFKSKCIREHVVCASLSLHTPLLHMQPFFNFMTSFYLLLARVCNKKENQMATLRFYYFLASFPVVLGDFRCDVTCQACRENSLGSKPPLVTQIARTGLGTRLIISSTRAFSTNRKKNLDWDLTSSCAPRTFVIKYS